jgi:CMP-N-acetylneuraminic acid synthetase
VTRSTLALIPARGSSKGVPGKNIRSLAGLPLLEHSIRLAGLCSEIARTVVSTDSEAIAVVARAGGAEVPFMRPAELAADETPMLPVLRHALEALGPPAPEFLLLLDPTSPARLPNDVRRAHELLRTEPLADGIVAVSEPAFNPIWHSVVSRDGFLEPLFPEAERYGRRQDVPPVYRINAALYLFRSAFILQARETWLEGRHLLLEIPEARGFHIDSEVDFRLCELAIANGLIELPWLSPDAETLSPPRA